MLTKYLNKVLARRDLTPAEMEEAFRVITGGEVAHSQIGAFLAALRMKGESCAELVGAARMLRRAAAFIDCGGREVVDVVGTGRRRFRQLQHFDCQRVRRRRGRGHGREARQPRRQQQMRFRRCAECARLQPRCAAVGDRIRDQ